MRLMYLPPYSPELNPAEHLCEAVREEYFANHVFRYLRAVERALTQGLQALEANPKRTQSMTGFKWITSISLTATWYQFCGRLNSTRRVASLPLPPSSLTIRNRP